MEIQLIGSTDTKRETIQNLVKEIPKSFPEGICLKLKDSGTRYSVKRRQVLKYGDVYYPEKEYDGMVDCEGKFWLSTEALKQYRLSTGVAVVLCHQDYIKMDSGTMLLAGLAGNRMRATRKAGGKSYSGFCCYEDRWILLGIPNEPSASAVKVGVHEVAHFCFDTIRKGIVIKTLDQLINGDEPEHCNNYAGALRCVMNPPRPLTSNTVTEMSASFCNSHLEKLAR
ncbi:hypothetical protein HY642_04465 [Candidatus Woesearchaeota archaeon]|nr:hypothetical protein [Candidatus Woesearchaeota archaeon]